MGIGNPGNHPRNHLLVDKRWQRGCPPPIYLLPAYRSGSHIGWIGNTHGRENNPKSLIKGLLVLVGIVALVLICYAVSKGAPALSLKSQPSASMLKLTDTILLLTEILGIAAIAAIIFAVIRNVITK